MSVSIEEIQAQVVAFRDARDWRQFHDPKNLALALSIEAAELNERFLWKKAEEADPAGVHEELADVFIYGMLLAHHYGFSIESIVRGKLAVNEERYPVDKARGSAKKYTDL